MSRQELKQHTLFTLRFVTAVASIVIAFSVIKILRQQQIQLAQQKEQISQQKDALKQAHKQTEDALARIHASEGEQIKIMSCQFALLGGDRSAVVTRAQFDACIKDTTFAKPTSNQHAAINPGSTSSRSGGSSSAASTPHKSSAPIAVVPSKQTTNPPTKNPTPTAPPEPPGSNPHPPTPASPAYPITLTVPKLLTVGLL